MGHTTEKVRGTERVGEVYVLSTLQLSSKVQEQNHPGNNLTTGSLDHCAHSVLNGLGRHLVAICKYDMLLFVLPVLISPSFPSSLPPSLPSLPSSLCSEGILRL